MEAGEERRDGGEGVKQSLIMQGQERLMWLEKGGVKHPLKFATGVGEEGLKCSWDSYGRRLHIHSGKGMRMGEK